MKTRKASTKLIAAFITMAALLAILASRTASDALAIRDDEETTPTISIALPSIGLAVGQTARIHIGVVSSDVGIPPYGAEACIVGGADDGLLADFGRVLIQPGKMVSFDLDGDSIDRPRDRFGRIQIRAVVKPLGGSDAIRILRISLEVFNKADGRTAALIGCVICGR